jgi:hypothetical protein
VKNRSVKCSLCKKRETFPKTDMYVEWTGKNKNVPKYWHHECWEESKEELEFIKNELQELDDLSNTIKNIHNLEKIPNGFYVYLQDLRNGTVKLGKSKMKKYKEGVPYNIIKKAYELSKKKIHWSKHNVNFKSDMSELVYGYKIMDSKINEAVKELKRLEDQQNFTIDLTNFNLKKFPKS